MEMHFQEMNAASPSGDNIDLQSWLFEEESFIGPSDFCLGAKENYSFINGQGSTSPQAITSDDIPGWTESHTADWYADLNLDDCLRVNLKGNDWNNTLSGEDAKLVMSVYDDYQKLMQEQDFPSQSNQSSFDDIQFEDNFVSLKELDGNLSASLESLAGRVEDIFSSQVNVEVKNEGDCIIDAQPCENEGDCIIDAQPCENEGGCIIEGQTYENEDRCFIDVQPHENGDDCFIYSQSYGNEGDCIIEAQPYERHMYENSPTIVTVPLSEAMSQPQLKVLEFDEPNSCEDKQFIYCKKFTISSPSVEQPIAQLKDVITEKGDELVRDLVESQFNSSETRMDSLGAPLNRYYTESPVETKRKRPYSLAERKLRKKEQNKRAAIRYREKKKEEQEQVFSSIDEEEQKNKELKREHWNMMSEMAIVKRLFVDLLIKKQAESLIE